MEVTHRRYRCPECGNEVWAGDSMLRDAVEDRGLVCPCTVKGTDLEPITGPEGEVRL